MFPHIKHVILDRDGVLNMERIEGGYVADWSQWRWIPGAIEGLKMLSSAGVCISVATNQSGVGRGLVVRANLDAIHARMVKEAALAGGVISHIFVCPHLPSNGCNCRKPASGLLLQAIKTSEVSRQATIAVGDDVRDLDAAWAADVSAALVRTGKGRRTEAIVADRCVPVFDDLRAFAAGVLSNWHPSGKLKIS